LASIEREEVGSAIRGDRTMAWKLAMFLPATLRYNAPAALLCVGERESGI